VSHHHIQRHIIIHSVTSSYTEADQAVERLQRLHALHVPQYVLKKKEEKTNKKKNMSVCSVSALGRCASMSGNRENRIENTFYIENTLI
jgi:hypothetical protein